MTGARFDKLELLRLLVLGDEPPKQVDSVADYFRISRQEVLEAAIPHGYPYAARINRAIAILAMKESDQKTCTKCGESKPLNAFYASKQVLSGISSMCIACNNSRPITPTRIVRNRARSRSYVVLAERHAAEFEQILAAQLSRAQKEHQLIQSAVAGQPDAATARLRPGPKRDGETVLDRLDVARCPVCHTHHDADHTCAECGTVTQPAATDEQRGA